MSSNLTGPTISIADCGFRIAKTGLGGESVGMSQRVDRFRAYVWPLAIAALIVAASGRGQVASPNISNFDKWAHFSVFGLLATLVCRLRPGWRGAVLGLVATSVFGATDEWHQAFVPGRALDVGDWIADTLGAALAVMLYAGWAGYRRLLEWPLRFRRGAD